MVMLYSGVTSWRILPELIVANEKLTSWIETYIYTQFTTMCCSPSGQAFAVGSFDRIRVYSWVGRKNLWEESKAKVS